MTAAKRKAKTEAYLKELGIPVNSGLPAIEEEEDVVIRAAADIAKRIFILVYLNIYAETGDRASVISFLQSEDLWNSVSEDEKKLLLKKKLSTKDAINISWRSEDIFLMLWAIDKTDQLYLPVEQCDIGKMMDLLPGNFESSKSFIANAHCRAKSTILDQADVIYRLHWAVREAGLNEEDIPAEIDSGIIQEWHYAINWIVNGNENWDDILTDT